MAIATLETARLRLRPYRAADLDDLQRYATRPAFYRFLPIPAQTPATVRAFLAAQLAWQAEANVGSYSFAIELKATGAAIGGVRIDLRIPAHDAGDFGYALDAEHQGRGYATEAVARVVDFGFQTLRMHRLWATPDVENERSCRLLERLGLRREGLLRAEMNLRGQWRDTYLYAILAEEWRACPPDNRGQS
jgi:RimJ/RimL family protein N-acetyltransferase